MTTKPAPHTPWDVKNAGTLGTPSARHEIVDNKGRRIVKMPNLSEQSYTDAALIVRAVNAHDELIVVLTGILEWYKQLPEPGLVPDSLRLSARLHEATNALRHAEGKGE